MTGSVNANWQSFWDDLPKERGTAVWDSEGEITASAQVPLFRSYFDDRLPVLDIGCGNGTQSRALAEHFSTVVGLDFAPAAIEHAKTIAPDSPVRFGVFDLGDTAAATSLHEELGDVNVYMRGVLHQMPDERRSDAGAALATLLGGRGYLFAVELSPSAGQVIQSAMAASDTSVPKLRRVFKHGLTPAAWSDGKLDSVLDGAGLEVVDSGTITLHGTDTLPDGAELELPMTFVLARTSR